MYSVFTTMVIILLVGGIFIEKEYPTVKEEPVTPVVFMVDGKECWVGNNPVIEFHVNDQQSMIEVWCASNMMDAYLPAIERTQ